MSKLSIKIHEHTSLTPTFREELVRNIALWNKGKWQGEDYLDLPSGHWVLLEAKTNERAVGYFMLAFDTPKARITLPIETVFSAQSEIFKRFEGILRGEAVFTIVDPSARRHGVFEQLVARVFWHILTKRLGVILSETEEPTIKLYRKMGLRMRKLSNLAKDYQGGPCFPCEIPFSTWYKLEGIISCVRYGTLREISFFGRG